MSFIFLIKMYRVHNTFFSNMQPFKVHSCLTLTGHHIRNPPISHTHNNFTRKLDTQTLINLLKSSRKYEREKIVTPAARDSEQ